MKGGTFTISNMGMLGVENFSAIINPGESAILAVSSSSPTAVVRDNKIEIRDIMKITISADHRVVDGADAAKFANALKKRLENPEALL
jgi:pyruvate dehydrogenase E2 component (dihydrolipoamide acetyltransferase)